MRVKVRKVMFPTVLIFGTWHVLDWENTLSVKLHLRPSVS